MLQLPSALVFLASCRFALAIAADAQAVDAVDEISSDSAHSVIQIDETGAVQQLRKRIVRRHVQSDKFGAEVDMQAHQRTPNATETDDDAKDEKKEKKEEKKEEGEKEKKEEKKEEKKDEDKKDEKDEKAEENKDEKAEKPEENKDEKKEKTEEGHDETKDVKAAKEEDTGENDRKTDPEFVTARNGDTVEKAPVTHKHGHTHPIGEGVPTEKPKQREEDAPLHAHQHQEDDGVNQTNVKNGRCANFIEGGLVRQKGLGVTNWKDVTREACWSNCNINPACEQAIFQLDEAHGSTECWVGTNFMADDKTEGQGCETCKSNCYAKNGFNNNKVRAVKDGFCHGFVEGFAEGHKATQCRLESTSPASQLHCSHFGGEYDLSEHGCWAKCEALAACNSAVYDSSTANCWIATSKMTHEPGPNQCPTCVNKCFAKGGFVAAEEHKEEHEEEHNE